jgi:NifU-like protein involved in Fe-S cluster formation
VITAYGHSGEPAIHTLVAASLLAELIEGKSIDEVLTRNYTTIKELGFEVSPRTKRTAVSALLAVRNAIHTYLDDGVEDSYDDLLTG